MILVELIRKRFHILESDLNFGTVDFVFLIQFRTKHSHEFHVAHATTPFTHMSNGLALCSPVGGASGDDTNSTSSGFSKISLIQLAALATLA